MSCGCMNKSGGSPTTPIVTVGPGRGASVPVIVQGPSVVVAGPCGRPRIRMNPAAGQLTIAGASMSPATGRPVHMGTHDYKYGHGYAHDYGYGGCGPRVAGEPGGGYYR